MDKRTINKIIDYLKTELLTKGLKLSGIALFGSQLKGTPNEDSDLDLIIISDEFENKNIFERSEITMEAEIKTWRKFHIPMDILNMTLTEYQKAVSNKRYVTQLV